MFHISPLIEHMKDTLASLILLFTPSEICERDKDNHNTLSLRSRILISSHLLGQAELPAPCSFEQYNSSNQPLADQSPVLLSKIS